MNCEHCKSVRTFPLHLPAIITSVFTDFSTGNMEGLLLSLFDGLCHNRNCGNIHKCVKLTLLLTNLIGVLMKVARSHSENGMVNSINSDAFLILEHNLHYSRQLQPTRPR